MESAGGRLRRSASTAAWTDRTATKNHSGATRPPMSDPSNPLARSLVQYQKISCPAVEPGSKYKVRRKAGPEAA
jgi:hypothetical protein